MYSPGPYFMGRYLAELPFGLLIPFLYGTIIYFAIGLDTSIYWKYPLNSKHLTIFNSYISYLNHDL